ncbi:MAG: aminoacetone oxidase family FAD-binding enzyme [Sarcina sp.]|nr:aminoacetone oxidase family FAD-binding enzyme [Sarcina sp.]HAL59995.1 aminoacetone oxidase family FAD-binding enzyme [Sarcina sp.]
MDLKPKMRPVRVAVIGGGASGCMAAITAAQAGADVHIFEKNEKPGKKLYATGNGRCNLTNLHMDDSCYHTRTADKNGSSLIHSAIERYSPADQIRFFADLGVPVYDRDGYVYPRTNQAQTVVRALEKRIAALGIRVHTGCPVRKIRRSQQGTKADDAVFYVDCNDREARAFDTVILCTGGMAGPQYGTTGDGYRLAASFSHRIRTPLPALTALECKGQFLKRAAGVRCRAAVTLYTGNDKKQIREGREEGEVQMTDYGISGIPVMQISGMAARLLESKQRVFVQIDFLPEFSDSAFSDEIERRMREDRSQMLGDLFLGLVHKKILDLLLAEKGLQAEMKARRIDDAGIRQILQSMREYTLEVIQVKSFKQAQVTSGGILLEDTDADFQSRLQPGLFFAGEVLDVDGRCGGYNLQWAFATGYIAGLAAAHYCRV